MTSKRQFGILCSVPLLLASSPALAGFTGLQVTREDFSQGFTDETGQIDMTPSAGPIPNGPTTAEKTALVWNGGETLSGEPILAFSDQWDVYRLWVTVDSPLSMVGGIAGSVDNNVDLILHAEDGGYFQSVEGPTTGIQFPFIEIWTGDYNTDFISFAFDSFLTMGTLDGGALLTDPNNVMQAFDAPCDGMVTGQNVGWTTIPEAGAHIVSDGEGGLRYLIAQLTVRKHSGVSGQLRVAGGGQLHTYQFSSAGSTDGLNFGAVEHRPLGQANLTTNASGNLIVDNIGSSGGDGVAAVLNESGEVALANGFAVTLAPINLAASGSAAFATCDMADCFDTRLAPAEFENEDGVVVGSAAFPDCDEVTIEFLLGGASQGSDTVPDGRLFEFITDGVVFPEIAEIACGFDTSEFIEVTFTDRQMMELVATDATFTADKLRLRPSGCLIPLASRAGDDNPVTLNALNLRLKNIEELTIDCENGVVDCPADCAPLNDDGTYGNGQVNIDDLLETVLQFGTSGASRCDISPLNDNGCRGDGLVAIDDILETIDALGACP